MTVHRLVGSQIENLTTERFVAFGNHLLQAERASQGLPLEGLTITGRINDKDGGVDARFIRANGSPFVAPGDSVWQFKLSPPNQAIIKTEVTKPGAAETLAAGGHYYLAIGRDCSDQVVENRRRWLAEETGRPRHVHVYSASHLAEWASWYPSVLVQHGFADHLREARSYSQWSEAREHESVFVQGEDRAALLDKMRTALGATNTAVIRLEGAPGSGKTRLVLETLRSAQLAPLVVYAPQAEDLPSSVLADLGTARPATIVVLDECDRQVHARLISALPRGAELRVITIGSEASVRDPDIEHVEVALMDRFGLQRLVSVNFPDITDTQAGWLADAADGSVRLALTLARRIRAMSEADLADLIGEGDVTQLLRLTLPTGERLAAAQVAALLRRFRWGEEHQSDIDALARASGLVPATFRSCVAALTADGVIVRQGRMRYVSPLPLAVHLAARHWDVASDTIAGQLLPALSAEGQDALLARTADLGRHPRAAPALGRLLGAGGPFGSLTALEDGWRASMFRYLATINPEQTLLVLENITGATIDQLKAATRSRRALVEASEKIAWNPPLFERAGDVLVRLALAENEAMSNNASGVFAQLFSTTLPGTAAAPAARLAYLAALTDGASEQQLRLMLAAVNCGLSGPQARLMTAEQQYGHAALPPAVPATAGEFRNYVGGLLDILRVLITSDTDVNTPALIGALRAVRVVLGTPAEDQVVDLVEWVTHREPRAVRVSSHEWRRFREHDGGTPQAWQRLDTVLAGIEPTDPVERLIDLAARPPWSIPTQHSEASAAYITELRAIRHAGRLADALTVLPTMSPPARGLFAIALAATTSDAAADWALLIEHSTDPYALGIFLCQLDPPAIPTRLSTPPTPSTRSPTPMRPTSHWCHTTVRQRCVACTASSTLGCPLPPRVLACSSAAGFPHSGCPSSPRYTAACIKPLRLTTTSWCSRRSCTVIWMPHRSIAQG